MSGKPLLTVKHLKTYFEIPSNRREKQYVKAVDDVSFVIREGEVLGLVGESGSGKSTIAYTVMGMERETGGEILLDGVNIAGKNGKRPRTFQKNVQIVFQDPGSSLNPYRTIRQILTLPLKVHNIVPPAERRDKLHEILEMVELPDTFLDNKPGTMNGGERQLVSIARALCCEPRFIILDEPTSSLDVSIQAKIINMLLKLRNEKRLTYLFITHDLSLMRNISTRVAILYLGKMCEIAPTETFYRKPLHPYTRMLLSSIPVISEEEEALKPEKTVPKGEIPSPVNIPSGCCFHTRCNRAMEICSKEDPVMREVESGHCVRCHLFRDCPASGQI